MESKHERGARLEIRWALADAVEGELDASGSQTMDSGAIEMVCRRHGVTLRRVSSHLVAAMPLPDEFAQTFVVEAPLETAGER